MISFPEYFPMIHPGV